MSLVIDLFTTGIYRKQWVYRYLRGVFKKRLNFLNSAPTSTESALRLLSTPSVKFWKQTAICSILLWELVLELHLLHWARAQAVCRISDKLTLKELEERVCMCVCVWKFAANLVKILQRHFSYLTKHTGRTVWASTSTKKSMDKLVRDQGAVGCVFWLERHCPSWICITWSGGKQTVVPGRFSAFEGCCAQEEAWIVRKPDLDVTPRQCASSCVAPHLQLSGKTSDICCAHPPYSPDLAPADFFLFPKLKTTLKGCCFQTIVTLSLIRRTACAHAQFSGYSSTTNAHSEMGQMAICCQNLTLGAVSSHSMLSLLVGALFKKFSLFLNTPCTSGFYCWIHNECSKYPALASGHIVSYLWMKHVVYMSWLWLSFGRLLHQNYESALHLMYPLVAVTPNLSLAPKVNIL